MIKAASFPFAVEVLPVGRSNNGANNSVFSESKKPYKLGIPAFEYRFP